MNRSLTTTLDIIAAYKPCEDGWLELLKLRGLAECSIADFQGDSTLFNVSEIGKLGRVDWLCWTARLFAGDELKIYRWFALWCAERVKHLMKDERSIKALEITRKFLYLDAGIDEIRAAYAAAAYSTGAADADAAAYAAADAAVAAHDDCAARAAARAADAAADAVYAAASAARAGYASAAAAVYASADAAARAYRVAYDSEKSAQLNKLVSALESGVFTTTNEEEEIK